MKIDLNRTVYREDETPRVKEFTPAPNLRVLQWGGMDWQVVPGVPKEHVTLLDALRAVYAGTTQQDTQETQRRKGRLLVKLNRAARKRVGFELTVDDAKFTLDMAADLKLETPVYIQIDDIINGRPTLGDEDEEQGDGQVGEEAKAVGAG
jgi:hypothetical protein